LVKPKTVLYGSQLPTRFFDCVSLDFPKNVDLLIVAGTSLTVSPANHLPFSVSTNTPRLVVNRERVGEELGIVYGPSAVRDIWSNKDCDAVFLYLAHKLGWIDDLKENIDKISPIGQQLFKQYEDTGVVPGINE